MATKQTTKKEEKKELKPFDFVNSILKTKKDLIRESDNPDLAEKLYNPYLTNKALSFYIDTVLMANDMNMYGQLDHLLQYDYLINTVRSMNRKHSWISKKKDDEKIEIVQQYYNVNSSRASEIVDIIGDDAIDVLKKRMAVGGKVK